MRWSYKTVHFSLKKEGLLGSAFLDEDEVEVSLNEYGHVGWELVSLMEVNDGLIAVFKQPLPRDLDSSTAPVPDEKAADTALSSTGEEASFDALTEGCVPSDQARETNQEPEAAEGDADGVGSIRIV